jgi:ABC-type Zn uptake system ZnuABC Zn-binding protein ZnuA
LARRAARALRAALLPVLALLAVAHAQPRVVVSIAPYQEPLQRLAGDRAVVDVLLPPGASPHAFDPTPRDVARLRDADLVVVNGGLDAWALELVDALGGDAPVFVALEALPADAFLLGGHDHEGEDPDPSDEHADEAAAPRAGGGVDLAEVNPHVWLDPVRMGTIVAALGETLAEIAPEDAAQVAERTDAYLAELRALDDELTRLLAPVAGAAFVPFHDAWPYFADRYGLDLILEVEPFPGREPSARALRDAIEAIDAAGARAVFTEVQLDDRPARVLADEAGVALGVLDPIGGTEGRRSYAELLRFNAAAIAEALRAP